jgi:hypothetical protein
MFCTKCGSQFSAGAGFCANCGTAAVVAPSSDPFGTNSNSATDVNHSKSTDITAPARKTGLTISLVAGAAVLAVGAAGFIFFASQIPITPDNARSFAVSGADVSFSSDDDRDADFSGILLDECPVKDEFIDLFSQGDTWFEGGISGKDDSRGFHITQRIFQAESSAELESGEQVLQDVANLEDCDSFAGTSYINATFDYTNAQDIPEAYGVNLKGKTFDLLTEICVDGSCVDSFMRVGFAYRGDVVLAFKYAGEGSQLREIENALESKLKAFAG